MIKNALAYIRELAVKAEEPKAVLIAGHTYGPGGLTRYDVGPRAEPIQATTLSALVEYIARRQEELRDHMIVHIKSPEKVELYSGLLEERDRETLLVVKTLRPDFDFGAAYGQEAFLIAMQACFMHTPDREAVTALASNIVNAQQAEYSDDGVTQHAIIKTGVTTKNRALVPNPVTLRPYRTFLEVEQPVSEFVFRIGTSGGGDPTFKLIEADGGHWKTAAMRNIYEHLNQTLREKLNEDQAERLTIMY